MKYTYRKYFKRKKKYSFNIKLLQKFEKISFQQVESAYARQSETTDWFTKRAISQNTAVRPLK